jgi:hypothetical protein
MTDIFQLSQVTIGSKESEVQHHQYLQAELRQLEEDGVVVPETVHTPTMALMDVAVARYRAAVSLNNANPNATAHSAGGNLWHTPTHPKVTEI